MQTVTAGRLLRANTRGCVVGCPVRQSLPDFGSMVHIPINNGRIFGLIYDMHIDDDGLVRQLATTENISDEVIMDNRLNRNTPVEISIVFIGYETGKKVVHRLPPSPPLSLDTMFICSEEEVQRFSKSGRFGYLRYLLTNPDIPSADLIAAHILSVYRAQNKPMKAVWKRTAIDMIIDRLRDNHDLLNQTLLAVSDAFASEQPKPEDD